MICYKCLTFVLSVWQGYFYMYLLFLISDSLVLIRYHVTRCSQSHAVHSSLAVHTFDKMADDTGASSIEKTFQFSMEDNIVNAIENIRCKRKRPSSEEIFFEIKKHDISVSIELFKDSLRHL